jgi:hypothetical protein
MDCTIELDIAAPRERVVELFVDNRNFVETGADIREG